MTSEWTLRQVRPSLSYLPSTPLHFTRLHSCRSLFLRVCFLCLLHSMRCAQTEPPLRSAFDQRAEQRSAEARAIPSRMSAHGGTGSSAATGDTVASNSSNGSSGLAAARAASPCPSPLPSACAVESRIIHTALLVRGRSFLKFGRTGRPHTDVVRLSPDLSRVFWGKKSVPVAELRQVLAGRSSGVFERFDTATPIPQADAEIIAQLSFSLFFTSRTLDLQIEWNKKGAPDRLAKDMAERDQWVAAFQWLATQGATLASAVTPMPQTQPLPRSRACSPAAQMMCSTTAALHSSPSNPASAPHTPNTNALCTPVRDAQIQLDSSSVSSSPLQTLVLSPMSATPPISCTPIETSQKRNSTSHPASTHSPQLLSSGSPPLAIPTASLHPPPLLTATADSGISRPRNVTRTTLVGPNFQWQRERLDQESEHKTQ